MRIKSKLQISALLTLFIAGISVVCMLTYFWRMGERDRMTRKIYDIEKRIGGLNASIYEYLLYYERRPLHQSHSTLRTLESLMADFDLPVPAEVEKLDIIRHELAHLEKVIAELSAVPSWKSAAADQKKNSRDLIRRLTSRVLVRTEAVSATAYRLHLLVYNRYERILKINVYVYLSLLVFLVLVAVARSIGVYFTIIPPISRLEHGTRALATGNLDYRVNNGAQNEIGELSRAFDRMAEKLKQTTVSRNELEQRVKERTMELVETNEELKRSQAQLVQNGKLTAVGELAAGVAHEINNPLTGVLMYALLLKERLELMPDHLRDQFPEFRERLDLIELSAQRCKSISDNLLAFSRQSDEAMTRVDLADVVSRTFDLIGVQLRHKKIRLVRKIQEGLPPVLGNANQLQQVFTNIILNAAWVTGENKMISVCATHRERVCEIAVSDTGPGIAPENPERIFDPFFTTKPIGKGTGLGLSLSYGLIQTHNGEIHVDSTLGQGSTFYVHLPVYTEKKNPP